MRNERVGILVVVVCLLAACGGGGGGGGGEAPGCNFAGTGLCMENWKPPEGASMDWDSQRNNCQENGGTWQSCPAANRAGTCTGTLLGGGSLDMVFYAGLVCSAAEGADRCQNDTTGFFSVSYVSGSATCGAESQSTVSCDLSSTSSHACASYDGAMSAERISTLEGSCAFAKGTVDAGCSATGRVAACQHVEFGLTVVETLYAGADLVEQHTACSSEGGTWTYY